MSPCLFSVVASAPSPWALISSLRTVLVLAPRGPQLESLAQQLRKGGFVPALTHTGEAALRRLVEEPIPALLLVHGDGEGSAHFLAELRQGGLLGWFSLVVVDGAVSPLPPGLRAQARLPADSSPAQVLTALEHLAG